MSQTNMGDPFASAAYQSNQRRLQAKIDFLLFVLGGVAGRIELAELNAEAWMQHGNRRDVRLARIAEIIESVDNRAMAADGPVTPTMQEMNQSEMSEIYKLAKGSG